MLQTSSAKPEQHLFTRFIRNAFSVIVALYGIITLLLLIATVIAGESFTPVNIFISVMPGALYPLIPLLLPILILKQWRLLLFNLPILLFALVIYGNVFLPASTSDEVPDFTVMTYNLLATSEDFETHAQTIREANADIVALQEAPLEAKEYFEQHLADMYPYQDKTELSRRVILSRYPFLDSDVGEGRWTSILYYQVTIDINGKSVVIYNTHLPLPRGFQSDFRRAELDLLIDAADADELPSLIIGDFNMSDASTDYRYMTQHFTDSFAMSGSGLGVTFPNFRILASETLLWWYLPPFIRLDYIFVEDAFRPLSSEVIYDGASDHFPVKTALQWAVD